MLFRSPQSELLKKRNRKASPELKGFAKAFQKVCENAKDPSDSQGIGTLKFDSHVACWQQRCHSPNVDCPLAAISKQPAVERKGDRLIRLIPTAPGVLSWGPPFGKNDAFSFPTNRNVQRIGGSHTAVWSFKSRLYYNSGRYMDLLWPHLY